MKTGIAFIICILLVLSSNAFAKNFKNICNDSKYLNQIIEYHTKIYFSEYMNDKIAFSNLKSNARELAESLCNNIGKRAYHGNWHPKPFDFGKIIGVTYFKKGQNIGSAGIDAKNDDFYYIIEEGGDAFVSQCSRVDPR